MNMTHSQNGHNCEMKIQVEKKTVVSVVLMV